MDERFRTAVLSGADRSLRGKLLRGSLSVAEPAYAALVCLRNSCYDRGLLPTVRLGVPVVSVGNLTTGGTGKTPAVAWIANEFRSLGILPGIVSRGYRSLDDGGNDEKRLLDQLCPGVPHVQNRDRVRGGIEAVERYGCSALVLDDGFQHRRLHRDVDVVLIDTLSPWGHGRLLPRGLLREPVSGLKRAHVVLLTRCGQARTDHLADLQRSIRAISAARVMATRFAPVRLINHAGEVQSLDDLRTRPVGAFCGIGNPEAFRHTLKGMGVDVSDGHLLMFPDHHHYSPSDLDAIGHWADRNEFDWLVTTRKDLVKIPQPALHGHSLWSVDIALEFLEPAEKDEFRGILSGISTVQAANGERGAAATAGPERLR